MRFVFAALIGLTVPVSAQAVVVVHYEALDMQCRSLEICTSAGDCEANTSMTTSVHLDEETYFGSFSPFAQKRQKWVRDLSYTAFDQDNVTATSTYRTLSNSNDAASTYRKSSFEERQGGWFGPELPNRSQPQTITDGPYSLFHARTLAPPHAGFFQSKTRQIIQFECERDDK